MASFPVVLQHTVAHRTGHPLVITSMLHASSALLLCRGADEILVPVRDNRTRDYVAEAIESLPAERRHQIRMVDLDGEILDRVNTYLEPFIRRMLLIGL